MRDVYRIDRIIEKLRKAWGSDYDLRFCQFISNITSSYGPDTFYLEDDQFEKLLDACLKNKK
jgi:uncharacterized protein YihD (DUF1040 family)